MTFKRSIVLALVLGGLGLSLRRLIWQYAYDASTQLIIRPQLLAMFNLFFCLCVAVVALLFLLRWPGEGRAEFPYLSDTLPPTLLRWASVVCYTGGGTLLLAQLYNAPQFSKVLCADGLLQLLQIPILALLIRRRDVESLTYASLTLFPAFTNCCLVVGLYHQVGAEPNPQVYLWAILGELFAAAAWVSYAGFGFQYQKGRRFGLLAHLALLILPVSIVAPLPVPWRLSLLAQLLWLLSGLLCLRIPVNEPGRTPEDSEGEMPLSPQPMEGESYSAAPQTRPHQPRRLRRSEDEENR